jgi:uncharacterized protein YukE
VAVAAKRVGSHAEDIRVLHSSTQAALEGGLYGCVGSSAEELARLNQRWSEVGTRHGERLGALSRHVSDTAVRLSDSDEANARRVARVGDTLR